MDAHALKWECARDGCFNHFHRPRLELLKDALPGKISFGDIDGIVQIGNRALILEFKSVGARVKLAQLIMYRSLAANNRITTFIIEGQTHDVVPVRMMVFHGPMGKDETPTWRNCNREILKRHIKAWCEFARSEKGMK